MPGSTPQRSSLTGPATGGLLVFSMHQKRVGDSSTRIEDYIKVGCAVYVVGISYHHRQGTEADEGVQVARAGMSTYHTQLDLASNADGILVYRGASEDTGDSTYPLKDTVDVQPDRSIPRLEGMTLWIKDTTPSGQKLGYHVSVLCACRDHPYAKDNVNVGQPYAASDD